MNILIRFLLFLFLLCCKTVLAQPSVENLIQWSAAHPIEKVYLHTDRETYFSGQTIWLKAYFMSLFMPSSSNSVLFVELLDTTQVIQREVFPVYGGMAPGQLILPDSLATGVYQIRAYSPLLMNQPGFVFSKRIIIHGQQPSPISRPSATDGISLTFFPEGGNFITGIQNKVAFKSTDVRGMPVHIQGEIRDAAQHIIATFKSFHDGMGTFQITPKPGESYTAFISGIAKLIPLPSHTVNGVGMQVTATPTGLHFKIIPAGDDPGFKPAYIIGQMQNRIVFKQSLDGHKAEISGTIKTGDMYSGILQLTVFNLDDMPLAQRIAFVDNKEYKLQASLETDTLDFGKWRANQFTIRISDTIAGNFSVSVTDADFDEKGPRRTNIYSSFLLSSDLKGYIHNPAYYFSDNHSDASKALDLVMMTHGWTRLNWSEVVANKIPKPHYTDPGFIRLSGKIVVAGTSKPLANTDIILFISPIDSLDKSSTISRIVRTDALGRFDVDSLLFYGPAKIVFSEVRGRKNNFIKVQPDPGSLAQSFLVGAIPDLVDAAAAPDSIVSNGMEAQYQWHLKQKGIVLQRVIVRGKEKSVLDKLDEEYSSGLFSGKGYSRKLDLRDAHFSGNIFDFLRERVPGLQIAGEPGQYVLNYRGGNLSYYVFGAQPEGQAEPSANNGNVTLFLNEMPINPLSLEAVLVDDIALVKLFPTSSAAAGGGPVLAVYTKKGKDAMPPVAASTDIITYQGFTIVKQFFSPEYNTPPQEENADTRITLQWIPDLFIIGSDNATPVRFYNTDRTNRFRIVVEGITSDGRILMIEKLIDAGGH